MGAFFAIPGGLLMAVGVYGAVKDAIVGPVPWLTRQRAFVLEGAFFLAGAAMVFMARYV